MARGASFASLLGRSLGVIVLLSGLLGACQPAAPNAAAPAVTPSPAPPPTSAPDKGEAGLTVITTQTATPAPSPTAEMTATATATPPPPPTAEVIPTLQAPPVYIPIEPITNTQKISDTVIPKIAGSDLAVKASELVTRTFYLPNGASVLLSPDAVNQLLSQIPADKLAGMNPEQIQTELARLMGSSNWAKILRHFSDIKQVGDTSQYLNPSRDNGRIMNFV